MLRMGYHDDVDRKRVDTLHRADQRLAPDERDGQSWKHSTWADFSEASLPQPQ